MRCQQFLSVFFSAILLTVTNFVYWTPSTLASSLQKTGALGVQIEIEADLLDTPSNSLLFGKKNMLVKKYLPDIESINKNEHVSNILSKVDVHVDKQQLKEVLAFNKIPKSEKITSFISDLEMMEKTKQFKQSLSEKDLLKQAQHLRQSLSSIDMKG